MQLHTKSVSLRKGVNLYRRIRYRKGFGVHSPFVFNLITKVIEESHPYYIFEEIEMVRRKLKHKEEVLTYPDRKQKKKRCTRTIADIVAREAISCKHGSLLFRLVNYFQSRNILQLGPNMGLSTLYLTSYASDINCIAIENVPEFAEIASVVFRKYARNPIDLRVGNYRELLQQALVDMEHVDFVFFNTLYEQQNNEWLFSEAVKYVNDSTIFVFDGIKQTKQMRYFWKEICKYPTVTVTVDLYSMGIVFFNPKLHKRDYIAYF